jgi:hypothetical protein
MVLFMNEEIDPQNLTETQAWPEPLDVMRKVFQDAEFNFEEGENLLTLRLGIKNLDVTVFCAGRNNDLASLYVLLPIRATEEFRANTGEFLHRLNYHSKRKFWEIDYNDGEIRLTSFTDTVTGPLTETHFRGIFHSMVTTADVAFPYLTSVLSGRMTPDFAADQAQAALHAFWKPPQEPEGLDGSSSED